MSDDRREREAQAAARFERLELDMQSAAGECLVPVPEPGTDMSKLLIANVLMRRTLSDVERSLSKATQALRKIADMAGSHTVSTDETAENRHPAGYSAIYEVAKNWR